MSFYHRPVMVQEVVDLLTQGGARDGLFVDATLGGGGHSEALLRSSPRINLIGFDRDLEAVQESLKRLEIFRERFRAIHLDFRRLKEMVERESVRGVILDLGLSSHQLDSGERGFSFQREGPLDMRMDQSSSLTAADMIHQWDEEELSRIFWEFGEEKFSRQIARKITEVRKYHTIRTTKELADLVASAMKRRGWHRIHPATRVFQAMRMAVNDELGALDEGLDEAWESLEVGGRLVVISFHSLEDRIVKNHFRKWAKEEGIGKLLNKKPIGPSDSEIKENPRSRSAKLRCIEKIETKNTK